MNVIISNKNEGLLNSLNLDVIKTLSGEYTADDIVKTFSNFFFNKMFLDITSIKDYTNISNLQNTLIFFGFHKDYTPSGSLVCFLDIIPIYVKIVNNMH